MTQTLLDLVVTVQVPLERHDLAKVTQQTKVTLFVLVAVGNYHLDAALGEFANQVAAHETRSTEHGGDAAVGRVAARK